MDFSIIAVMGLAIFMFTIDARLRKLERQLFLLERTPRRQPPEEDVQAPEVIAPKPPLPRPLPKAAPRPPVVEAPPPVEEKRRAEPFYQRIIAGGFEELFGSRLPIWAGGITLAVAGLFIVKYSIDQGLLSESVRVALGLIFAGALIAGAEASRRWKQTAIDPRVAQALSGAGIAAAYGSILMAINVYAIIAPVLGFIALAAITAAALALALRFGAPSAVLGLVGGLAAPALVGATEPNMPLLALYLILAIGGLSAVARREKWGWLASGALLGGFGWGALMLLGSFVDTLSISAVGIYLLMLGLALPLLGFAKDDKVIMRAVPMGLAAVQIAVLVIRGGFAPLEWGLYGLLGVGTIILARIDRRLDLMPRIAMLVALFTLAAWLTPPLPLFGMVIAGITLLFVLPPLATLWSAHGKLADAIQPSVGLIALFLIAAFKLPTDYISQSGWGAIALACAALMGGAAAIGWLRTDRQGDARFAVIMAVATLFASFGLTLILPVWAAPASLAALILGLTIFHRVRPDWQPLYSLGTAALFLAGWLAEPLATWAFATLITLYGEAMLVTSLATPRMAVTHLAIPTIILSAAVWQVRNTAPLRLLRIMSPVPALLALVAAFILFKQIFAIADQPGVEAYAFAERIILTQLLFGAAYLLWRERARHALLLPAAAGVAALAMGRTVIYDMLVYSPMLVPQAVGAFPIANLLIPAYLFPLGWLILGLRSEEHLRGDVAARITTVATMALVITFAFATLSQFFHGTFLTVGEVGETEDIMRSLLAIALAVVFLRYGIYARDRVWRITSLVMMLGAVAKVFVFDASGLDGLMRIGSFIALGFSLIGIGWLYSRHLKVDGTASSV
jgi:uncharacterized membrane protein